MIKTTYEEELDRKGKFTYTCCGVSMLPLLRQKKDLFTIEKKQGRYKKYDVVLYKRPPKSFVLHRIVEVREKDYVILGDNCLNKEYGIRDEDILGVMTSFVRNGKEYSVSHKGYQIFVVVWYFLYPLRKLLMKCKNNYKKRINTMTDKSAVSWLLKIAGKYKGYIILLLLLQTLVNGAAVYYALAMKNLVDSAVGQERQGFFNGLITFGLLMMFLMLIRVVIRQIEEAARSGLENSFKERLFKKLLRKDYEQVNLVHSEEWMNRMTSDTAVCAGGMTDIFPGFTGMIVRMSGALMMMFFLQPKLAYIFMPGGVFFVLITLILRKYLKGHHKRVQEKDGAVRVYLQERISSMLILRTFGVENQALSGAESKLTEHKRARMRKAFISNICNTGFSFAVNGMYLIGIGYCGYGILNGVVSYGTLTAIIQLIGQLQAPLSGISGFVPRFYAMLASAERLMEIENYKEANVKDIITKEEAKVFYDNAIEKIVFDKVSFDYTKENDKYPVLDEVSLSVHKGDYIAITGTSGCGKSTLLKLLMGVFESGKGDISVVLNDSERQPIGRFRRLFAYVPQGNFLMGGTIREVITFGMERSADSKGVTVEQALKLACGDFVFELPEGIDTVLGEKGAGLSEGQMQRIAIARALYANAPVLILDEATSALDNETEGRLLNNLKLLTDMTVLIVTHRSEALKICNRRFEFTKAESQEVTEIEENTI